MSNPERKNFPINIPKIRELAPSVAGLTDEQVAEVWWAWACRWAGTRMVAVTKVTAAEFERRVEK